MLTYIYAPIHTHLLTYTHPHIYIHKVLTKVYLSSHLVISSYHMSSQQYFDILLNYKKPEIYCYKKKMK